MYISYAKHHHLTIHFILILKAKSIQNTYLSTDVFSANVAWLYAINDDDNGKDYGKRCVEGDIVDMILNFNNLTLRYKMNDKEYGNAFENIEYGPYRAAVSVYWKDEKFENILAD